MDFTGYKLPLWLVRIINWKYINKCIICPINSLRSPIKIAVYGESGVGKTEFINSIIKSGHHAKKMTRDIERGNELTLPNGRRIEFIDTPGQPSYRSRRLRLFKDYTKGEIKGIIHVVSYGYLSKEPISGNEFYDARTNKIKESFLTNNRQLELDGMDEWLAILSGDFSVKWVLTVVNKADLWYSDEAAVTKYYNEGDYCKKISKVNGSCKICLQFYCSTFKAFLGHSLPQVLSSEEQEVFYKELMQELYKLSHFSEG